jgi:hypothetical protein
MPDLTVTDLSGLSTAAKPVAPQGTRFFETDTGDTLVSDGTYWWLRGVPGPFSTKRWGIMTWGAHTIGDGMLNLTTAATGAGGQTFAADNTNGRYLLCVTGTTIGNKGGYRVSSGSMVMRQWNPRMRFRFLLNATTDHTLSRGYFGFTTNVEPTGDDPLNARSGFMIGWISTSTNFIVIRNDVTGATDLSGNVAATAQALDTFMHTVSIVADEPNSRWSVKWDANDYVHYTTDIPVNTAAMTIFFHNETAEISAKNFRLFSMFTQVDK